MYTGQSLTYDLKSGESTLGHFYSGGRFIVDFNQNIVDWSEYGSRAWTDLTLYATANVRIIGSYKPNNSTARLAILGEVIDSRL